MTSLSRLLLLSAVFVATSALDCGHERPVPRAIPPAPSEVITGVTVTPNMVSLVVGAERQLTATVTGTITTTVPSVDQTVRWTASNEIATVSATGLVRAVSPGTVVITATSVADPTKRGASTVVVQAPAPAL
jgi:uncharacterized protein YjdB